MATTKAEFQELADELVDIEFIDFFPVRDFSLESSYDPMTGTSSTTTDSAPCMREEYNASQFNSDLIQVGDFKLLAKVDDFTTITPSTNGVKVDVDGKEYQIIRAEKDAADAIWTMQVRAL